jgi:hypothetical protein
MLNQNTGNIAKNFQPHTKKITHIYIKEGAALITTSHDGKLKITSLCVDFDHLEFDLNEFELSCFALRAPTFNPSNIEFFIGSALGKLYYYYKGWIKYDKEQINDNNNEGPITTVVAHMDIVAWATPQNIRVIHYQKKQKMCIIERPKKHSTFPEYLYTSNAIKPSISWRKNESGEDIF